MKNPWISLWLSGANAWSGAMRGLVSAEMKRTQKAMMDEAARQAVSFWFPQLPSTSKQDTTQTGKSSPAPARRRAASGSSRRRKAS